MSLKILTVDDSKMIRTIIKKALKPYDCQLFEAENGVEGLTQTLNHKPDLIILDITMPVMTGMEMIAKLKSDPATKPIPVLMLTAEASKENVMEILKMGAAGYMLKPFKGEDFVDRIQKIVPLNPKEAAVVSKYFSADGEFEILRLPDKVDRGVASEIEEDVKAHLNKMKDAGRTLLVLDLGGNTEVTVSLIKVVLFVIRFCRSMQIRCSVAGTDAISRELKEVEETRQVTIHLDLWAAKDVLTNS